MDNNIIHLPEPPPGHFMLRDSFSCGLGFVVSFFNEVKSKTAAGPFFSLAAFHQYMVSSTGNFAGGKSNKRFGKKDVSN